MTESTWPYETAPKRASSRIASPAPSRGPKLLWIIGGLLLGVLLTLGVELFLAPRAETLPSSSGTGDVSITIDDSFATHQAVRGLSLVHLPFTVTNVRAHINAGNSISISGVASTGPVAQQFAATSQVGISDGQLVSHLTSAQVGSVELPGPVTSLLDQAIDTQLDDAVARLLPSSTGLVLSSINTTSGRLTLIITQQ